MEYKELSKLTLPELIPIAEKFGIEVGSKKRPQLLSEIHAFTPATKEDGVPLLEGGSVEDDVPKEDAKSFDKGLKAYGFSGRKVKVVFMRQDGIGGKDDVFIGLNRFQAYYPREKEVWIPEELLGVLGDAIGVDYDYDPDTNRTIGSERRTVSYQVG